MSMAGFEVTQLKDDLIWEAVDFNTGQRRQP